MAIIALLMMTVFTCSIVADDIGPSEAKNVFIRSLKLHLAFEAN